MSTAKLDIKKMIRPNCGGFEPYIAGKPVETIKRELGLKKVVKLASNENPLGPSPRAVEAVRAAMTGIYFYPDSNSWGLKNALAGHFGLDASRIILGAGSDEIIELVAKLFFEAGDDIVVSEHAFLRYQMAGQLMACRTIQVPMKGFTHDLEAMARAVTKRTKAVFVANPNNPTGTYNARRELERFLAAVAAKGGKKPPLVIVDEAYYEYARRQPDYPDTIAYLKKYPNLIIMRTFSKIYALAGLRVGYAFAAPEVVDYIDRIRPPFNINSLAQAAAVASIADRRQVVRGSALVEKERKYLYRELERRGIPFVPSLGNFILMDVSPWNGADLFRALLKKGVIVRAMDEYNYPHHVRVSIGLPDENRFFIKMLDAVKK